MFHSYSPAKHVCFFIVTTVEAIFIHSVLFTFHIEFKILQKLVCDQLQFVGNENETKFLFDIRQLLNLFCYIMYNEMNNGRK
jgi:hypothetical protein